MDCTTRLFGVLIDWRIQFFFVHAGLTVREKKGLEMGGEGFIYPRPSPSAFTGRVVFKGRKWVLYLLFSVMMHFTNLSPHFLNLKLNRSLIFSDKTAKSS